MGFFVRIYMRVCKKMVMYLGIKTPQSRKERNYTWQKNARISCHNFETNDRPYICWPLDLLVEVRLKSFNIVVFGPTFDGLGRHNCRHCLDYCSVYSVEFVVKKGVNLLGFLALRNRYNVHQTTFAASTLPCTSARFLKTGLSWSLVVTLSLKQLKYVHIGVVTIP